MPGIKKQQRNINPSSNVKLRKPLCKKKKSINLIENLSNEIFYEIFDYLDACEIYTSFSNLNIRFQNILTNPSFLKIQFSSESESTLEYRFKHFINSNKNQIISLHFHDELLINKFFNLCTIDSSFNHLESIILNKLSTFKLTVLLFFLKTLPRLFSLTVFLQHCHDNIGDIYHIVFHLPVLKYFKLEIIDYDIPRLTIPIIPKEQYSPIQCLSIFHFCTLNELTTIISNTPHLTHLHCFTLIKSEDLFEPEVVIRLNNLSVLNISLHYLLLDEFEPFLMKLCSKLTTLCITIQCSDGNYLDANRWECFITEYIPYLDKFILSCSEDIDDDFKITPCHTLINRFISPFWINKNWIFRILIENDDINYLLRPYREPIYDFQEHDVNSSFHYYSGVNINITKICHMKKIQKFINKIGRLFKIVDVTRLVIECGETSANTFIKILNLLPNLDMLRITILSSSEDFFTSVKKNKNLRRFLNNNKITKLTIRNISGLEDIYFIIDLFPRIECFAIRVISNADLLLVVECTLRKIKENNIRHPMRFCVVTVQATNDKVEKLKEMIDSKHLLKDYITYRRRDIFYLEWK